MPRNEYSPWSFHGLKLVENEHLVQIDRVEHVVRTWRERLFTRPWQPHLKTRTVPHWKPDPSVYVIDNNTIVAHPEVIAKIKQAIEHEREHQTHSPSPVLDTRAFEVDQRQAGDSLLRAGGPGRDVQSGLADFECLRATGFLYGGEAGSVVGHSGGTSTATTWPSSSGPCSVVNLERLRSTLTDFANLSQRYAEVPFVKRRKQTDP